jgi:carbon-monoxide dehydrogenase small subunit
MLGRAKWNNSKGKDCNGCSGPCSHEGHIDREILTIQGLEGEDGLHSLQEAFIKKGATQCGFCTPGMLPSGASLPRDNPNPTEEEIRAAISGNPCRCTGYQEIVEAIRSVAEGDQE